MLRQEFVDYLSAGYLRLGRSDLIVGCLICRRGSIQKLSPFILRITRRKCELLRRYHLCTAIACVRVSSLRTLFLAGFRVLTRFASG